MAVQPADGWVYVGFWRRLWAYLIDGLILTVPVWLIAAPLVWNPFINAFVQLVLAPGAYIIDPATGAYTATPATLVAITNLIDKLGPQSISSSCCCSGSRRSTSACSGRDAARLLARSSSGSRSATSRTALGSPSSAVSCAYSATLVSA